MNRTLQGVSYERWLTFDCFGTLVSWQRGFPQILGEIAGARADELAAAYHLFEAELEAQAYRPYREILTAGVRAAAERIGLPISQEDAAVLVRRWDTQPIWGDVGESLATLQRQGWKLAALTNCDRDLFARTQATLPVAFDLVVTAQDTHSYKPALGHFHRFKERTGASPDRRLHVACSWFHDIEPAARMGVSSIWIDRDHTGDDPSIAAAVLPDLRELPTVVERLRPHAVLG